jgi:hypothetical protein
MQSVESIDALPRVLSGGLARTEPSRGSASLLVAYASAIFLSAFLLFQVQPLMAKFILPWFGGTPGVWTVCILFFQAMLLGGYAYAHFLNRYFRPRRQVVVHATLLVAACLTLPIIPTDYWKPTGSDWPGLGIMQLLIASVGIPFFLLSSTGPLLQAWFSRTHEGRSPYRLYALSNVGSLIALVSYPFVFDWIYPTRVQAQLWSGGFVAFALLCGICALAVRNPLPIVRAETSSVGDATVPTPSLGVRLLWVALATIPSVLLLATTNQVCLDVASVPFLWVLPLTLYLLSFILCFDSDRWYSRRFAMPGAVLAIAAVYPALWAGNSMPLMLQVVVYFSALFWCAMVCHGELARLKPHARHLTSFYLLISAGGATGGIFVAVIAPLIFLNYFELHLGLFACAILILVVLYIDDASIFSHGRPRAAWLVMLAGLGTIGAAFVERARAGNDDLLAVTRNFYGVLRVVHSGRLFDEENKVIREPYRMLKHGPITHGGEFEAAESRGTVVGCYGPKTAIGQVLKQRPHARPQRVAVVGLGVGTLAAYAKPGDEYRFYEIDPMVVQYAREYFHFLADCRCHYEVLVGDGRLTLEREPPQDFDVIVLDALTGDAVPTHLLTVEAFAIYLRHLAPDGVIAVHVASHHYNIQPVVAAVAESHRLESVAILSVDESLLDFGTIWMLVGRDLTPWNIKQIRAAAVPHRGGRPLISLPVDHRRVLWTDDHSSLFEVLGDDN